MAWTMVRHAFTMIFRNIVPALQSSVAPILVALAISYGVILATDLNPLVLISLAVDPRQMAAVVAAGSSALILGIVFLMLVYAFVFAWICVAWHRFILLEEKPGLVPAITGRPIWLYVGTTILLAVLLILLAIPVTLALGMLAGPLIDATGAQHAAPLLMSGIGLFVDAFLSYLWFRFAVVLPAAAIGRPMTLGDGWSATSRISVPILGAVLILMGATVLAGFGIGWVAEQSLWLGFAGSVLVQWLTLLMGASVLTTIYGVGVEKRALV